MMYAELEKVMAYSLEGDQFLESLRQNVTGKKSNSGAEKTAGFLKRLYGFDILYPPFAAFKYFWKVSDQREQPLLALVYAVAHDDLLAESVQVLQSLKPGEKAAIELFEAVIEKGHPNQYSANTLTSMAQNIASSWKQAGFIQGKTKNLRIHREVTYLVACFAFLLAYLQGSRGDFIWGSRAVTCLCLYESKLRDLAIECAKRDLMQYQYAGSVTAINFTHLLHKIGIGGYTN
jgi:hypothetical protein